MLADPAGLAYRASSGEVFVGNRHGNNSADGTAGSIVRFRYDRINRSFTMTSTITGNGLSGVHGMTFSPTTGELFAANFVGCVSRFTFDGAGTAMPKGSLGSGSCRGVRVSADGKRLYVTTATTVIKMFDLTTGVEAPSVTVADNPSLHGLAWQGGMLYAAGLTNNKIHRFLIDLGGQPAAAGHHRRQLAGGHRLLGRRDGDVHRRPPRQRHPPALPLRRDRRHLDRRRRRQRPEVAGRRAGAAAAEDAVRA